MRMYVIAVVAVVLIAGLLYLLDRALKAVQQGRRRRDIVSRMAPAIAHAEEQAKQKKQVKETSSALTSVLPSIQQPEKGPRRVA
jgi:uncharacterized membrane protein YhiD involved in acid resistance